MKLFLWPPPGLQMNNEHHIKSVQQKAFEENLLFFLRGADFDLSPALFIYPSI